MTFNCPSERCTGLHRTGAVRTSRFVPRDAEGRPVSMSTDYAQTTLRLPPACKAELEAVAVMERRSQSLVVETAIRAYVASLPLATRRIVEEIKTARLATAKKR